MQSKSLDSLDWSAPMRSLRRSPTRVDRRGPAVVLAFSFMLMAQASAAVDLSSAQKVAGQWDLSLSDTNRRCRLVLRTDGAGTGFNLGLPAGCRRAMPLLSEVGSWVLEPGDRLVFADAKGKEVLTFAPNGEGLLLANGPEGETYQLATADTSTEGRAFAEVGAGPLPGFEIPKPVVVAATTTPAATAKSSELAGRYSVLREGGKDTGCMLTLDDKARGPKGSSKAVLAPACRDQGLVIFDPVGWSIEKGRLTLTARKGHHAHFERGDDGNWMRDAKEGGKALGLKKM
ncbi:MAG: hypothetical protein NVSMB26_09960 [Beijerinckiaceae bacterium]